jgi:lytic murein transglycosylase
MFGHRPSPWLLLGLSVLAGCATRSSTAPASADQAQVASSQTGVSDQEPWAEMIRRLDQKSCPEKAESFQDWLARFQSYAHNQGRPDAVIEAAFSAVKENPEISERAAKQPEFVTPIWTYLERAVSPERIARGKEMLTANEPALQSVSQKYGVDDGVILGIWGIETDFGRNFGSANVFEALSNVGYRAGRYKFACAELMSAIDIVANDNLKPEEMVGSWAGAMGHPQFLPSSFLKLAVDEDSSGAPDLWSSMPDVFASIANHLKRDGWQDALPWGFEVKLPDRFPYAEAELDLRRPVRHGAKLGVQRINGDPLPALSGDMAILLPAGWRGPAFLVTRNFEAILKYNYSTSYALSVGILGDRIKGGPEIAGTWPTAEQPLSLEERQEVQTLLAQNGFDPGKIDGILGLNTRKAARKFQAKIGWPQDGFVSKALLSALRNASAS